MDIFNLILQAVSCKLDTLYPEVPIFCEIVPQKLPERCFILHFAGSPEIAGELDNRSRVSGTVDIAYFAPQHALTLRQEHNRVFAHTALQLRQLSAPGLRLTLYGHRRQDVDRVLHVLANFQTWLYKVDSTPKISDIRIADMEAK